MNDDSTMRNPQSKLETEGEDRSQPGGKSTEHDPASKPVPPGNPPIEEGQIERAEEQLNRISGR